MEESLADLDEAAGAGPDLSSSDGRENKVVAEQGVLCDHIDRADEARTRPSQVCRNDDPVVHQSGRTFRAARLTRLIPKRSVWEARSIFPDVWMRPHSSGGNPERGDIHL
jgi:hypothetical protein